MTIELTNATTASIVLMLVTTFGYVGKDLIKFIISVLKDKNKVFVYKSKRNEDIKKLIRELRIWLHADRSAIFEFSNTEESISGFGFTFLSMTYEDPNDKLVPRIAQFFTKVLAAHYPVTLGNLDKSNVRYRIYHRGQPDLPKEIEEMMEQHGLQTSLMYRLHPTKLMYGTLTIHWHEKRYSTFHNELYPDELEPEHELEIRMCAEAILKAKQKPKLWLVSIFSKEVE